MAGIPANIVLRNLTTPPIKGAVSPLIATASGLRNGTRNQTPAPGPAPAVTPVGTEVAANLYRNTFEAGVFASAELNDCGLYLPYGLYNDLVTDLDGGTTGGIIYNDSGVVDPAQQVAGRDWRAFEGSNTLRVSANSQVSSSNPEQNIAFDTLGGRDLWVRYWMRVPTNYEPTYNHLNSQHKIFVAFQDGYSQNGTGSTVWVNIRKNGDSMQVTSTIREGTSGVGAGHVYGANLFHSINDQGRWMQLVHQCRLESSPGANDGEVRTWRRWSGDTSYELIMQRQGLPLARSTTTGQTGWRWMRLLSAREGDRDEREDYLFDILEVASTPLAPVVLLSQADFDDGLASPDWTPFTSATGSLDFSQGFARGVFPDNDGSPAERGTHVNMTHEIYVDGQDPDADIYEVFVQFDARMPLGALGGLKFCKVFGIRTDSQGNVNNDSNPNFANTTFGLWYTNGEFQAVSWGDGATATNNDTNSIVSFNGTGHVFNRADGLGVVATTPKGRYFDATDWGTDWHRFHLRVRFNSGTTAANETNDGLVEVYIDGELWARAENIYNRHYSNRGIYAVKLFGWTEGPNPSFTLDIDNVHVTTGGWVTAPEPLVRFDFENGDTLTGPSKNDTGFSWAAPSNIGGIAASPLGDLGLEFNYNGPDGGGDDSTAEQRYELGGGYAECYEVMDLYIPANFEHRALIRITVSDSADVATWQAGDTIEGGAVDAVGELHSIVGTYVYLLYPTYFIWNEPYWDQVTLTNQRDATTAFAADKRFETSNNKFWALWTGTYSANASIIEYSPDWSEPDGTYLGSTVIAYATRDEPAKASEGASDYIIAPADVGTRVTYAVQRKKATALGAADGVFKIWKNGALIYECYTLDDYVDTNNVFERGYLLGYSNSGFDAALTQFYVHRYEFWGVHRPPGLE